MTQTRKFRVGPLLRGLCLSLAAIVPFAAHADWPERPIHMVVPFPPGSSPDILARTISEPLSQALGQPIVIDNKPGAGGNIGTRMVAQAKPDGYTLLYTINGPLVTAPTLYKKTLGYDPLTDLEPVSLVGTSPNVLVVPGSLKVDNVQDFVKLVKGRGNSLNYGSVGPGSSAHLAMEMFKESAGVDLAHIPYSGFPQVITAIIGGDVQAGFMVPAIAVPQARDGKVKLLAVTSLQPSDALPGVPTMASQGYPDFEAISWNAILAPSGTPTPIVERLNSELARIINSDAVRKQLALQYFTPAPSTPEALTARIKNEKARWDQVIDKLKLSLD
ncbi:tripartite tricarboxylate transporter substrate binding protein [Achromobacter sp. JD417]|uniref:Bug family tripartite tricarboxylate transporter substrate binding protein n=1 Tax=Achromobacter sp. JD417 TaxID=2893881 RepID=UPI0035A6AD2F